MRVAFCVSGRGSLFRAAAEQAPELGIVPVLLLLEHKADLTLDGVAAAHGVECQRLAAASGAGIGAETATALDRVEPDLIVLTFDRILPPAVVERYPRRIINVHPALLPAFAGMRGLERTLESGARFGGATIHEVVADVDAGPIIAQAVLATDPAESATEYGHRMYALLEPMFRQVLRWYAEGRVDHDDLGRVVVRGATYGTLPISPALE